MNDVLADMPWHPGAVLHEPAMLFKTNGGLEGRLLFPPARILGIDAWIDGQFQAVPLDDCMSSPMNGNGGSTGTGGWIRLSNHDLPFLKREEIVRPPGSPMSYMSTRDGKAALLFSESGFFHTSTVRVSYTHEATWQGLVPGPAPGKLPRSMAAIHEGNGDGSFNVLVLGDSISTGCDCSAKIGLPPHEPSYMDSLLSRVRRAAPGLDVRAWNLSEGGRNSRWGLERVRSLVKERRGAVTGDMPGAIDLVIIAFGANDAAGRRSPRSFHRNIQAQVKLLERCYDAEIILVASSLMNERWSGGNNGHLLAYRDRLHEIARKHGQGTAVADMTTLWGQLLERKDYYDLTGNGLNHPNDWGHRMHASILAGLLGIT